MRCPRCRVLTPAFWLNGYSVALWVVLVAANYYYVRNLAPIVIETGLRVNVSPDPIMLLHITLARLVGAWGVWALALAVAALVVLRVRRIALPNFLKSGKALAVVTWLGLVISLGGIVGALVQHILQVPLPQR